jgi:hypothetical protein
MSTRDRLIRGCGFAWLVVTLLGYGCASIGGPRGFVETPVDPGSRQLQCGRTASGWPRFERVVIVVFENQNFEDVINDYRFQAVAKDGASFTHFQGLFHPSYSNYLAMVSGREIVTHFDAQVNAAGPTIGDRLEAKQMAWKNYAEGYPKDAGCFTDDSRDRYARRHVPFMSFLEGKTERCERIVNAAEFEKDVKAGALPQYTFYSPDLDHDGHDPVAHPRAGLGKGARWLTGFLKQYRPLLKDTLIVVTFDESRDDDGVFENHIYTVFLGDMVKAGEYDTPYNHYNVLATIADNFGVDRVGDGDGCARPIEDVWK